MEDISKLLQALSTIIWPLMLFYLIFYYRKKFGDIIESLKYRSFSGEAGSIKINLGKGETTLTTLDDLAQKIDKQIEDVQKNVNQLRERIKKVEEVEGVEIVPETEVPKTPKTKVWNSILWVDDKSENNIYMIARLEKRGYKIDLARSTAEGLEMFKHNPYHLVLSDLGRFENGRYNETAGLEFLEELNKLQSDIPFVIFSSNRSRMQSIRKHVEELHGRAITSTTELQAIFDEFAPDLTQNTNYRNIN